MVTFGALSGQRIDRYFVERQAVERAHSLAAVVGRDDVEVVLADLAPVALPDLSILRDENAHAFAGAEDLWRLSLIQSVRVTGFALEICRAHVTLIRNDIIDELECREART